MSKKMKAVSLLAMASTGLLLSGGCDFGGGWWPWAVGAGLLGLLGLAT